MGHLQRGGTPTAFDRMLATRYGLGAIDAVHKGAFGQMVAIRGNKILTVPVSEAIAKNRTVDQDSIDIVNGILEPVGDKK
jgi:6-phosphofructokinase 1